MLTKYLTIHRKDILIFVLLIFIVGWLQAILLEPHLNYGFTPDDWWPLKNYEYLSGNFFSKILEIWKQSGAYLTYQVLYIGILHNFFGFNFEAYQITNHILKGLSALAVYLLIYVVFKSRLLAFVSAILYAMAYSPVGTLELVVRGSDFIAIVFMCIFFIAYYHVLVGGMNNASRLIGLTTLLLISMFFSPIRIYPVLIFILLIESYLCLLKRSKLAVLDSIKRICFVFSPYIIMIVLSPSSFLSFTGNALAIIEKIAIGNWQLTLYPLGSLGSLFLLNDYWRIFGVIHIKSFDYYFGYLLVNPLLIFLLISLIFAVILPIPTKRFFKFFLKILSINIFFQILVFVLAKHSESIDSSIRMAYDSSELYPVFFAIFILVLSFLIWQEWVNTGKKNNVLFALWVGPFFSFVFIFWTWIFKDWAVLFKGVHTYLNIPSIGISLFIGSVLVLIYQKIRTIRIFGKSLAPLVFLLLIPIFSINNNTIQLNWIYNNYSMDAKEHEVIREKLWSKLIGFDNKRPSLFYFDTSGDYLNGRFYEQSMLGRFSDWMFFKGNFPPGSCAVPIFIINHLEQLKDIITVKEGKIGFYYHNYCKPFFYQIQDFYAFKLNNRLPIDIKDQVLKQLEIIP